MPDLPAERGHDETILLMEDELAILGLTSMMLERLGYAEVAAATTGEAIRLAYNSVPLYHTGCLTLSPN